MVEAITISIDSALKIVDKLSAGETTTEKYRISGKITKNITNPTDIPSRYTDINFVFKDSTNKELTCYYTKNLNNKNFTSSYKVPLAESEITVVGALQKYMKGDSYTPELINGFIESYQKGVFLLNPDSLPACPPLKEDQISLYQVDSIGNALGSGGTSKETYKTVGVVYSIGEAPSSYKNATFTIMDNSTKTTFYCYRVKVKGTTAVFSNPAMLAVGDTVFIESPITNYKGTIETENGKGYIYWSSNKNLGFPSYEEISK